MTDCPTEFPFFPLWIENTLKLARIQTGEPVQKLTGIVQWQWKQRGVDHLEHVLHFFL